MRSSVLVSILIILTGTCFSFWKQGSNYFQLLEYFPIFSLGILLSFYNQCNTKNKRWMFVVGFILIAFVVYLNFNLLVLSIVGFTSVLIFFNKELKVKWLYNLGSISYSLYLFHTIFGFTLLNLFMRFEFFNSFYYRLILLVLTMVFTIKISHFIHNLIEQPFIKLSKKIHYK